MYIDILYFVLNLCTMEHCVTVLICNSAVYSTLAQMYMLLHGKGENRSATLLKEHSTKSLPRSFWIELHTCKIFSLEINLERSGEKKVIFTLI